MEDGIFNTPEARQALEDWRNENARRVDPPRNTSTRPPPRVVKTEAVGMDEIPFAPYDAEPAGEVATIRDEAGAAKGGGKSFQFVAVGDLELTEPEFHVDGMIETEAIGVVFGNPGCGKSFLAVDLACSVASGRDFHGRKVRQGSVFYIAGEGHNGLARRFHAWGRHHGQDMTRLPVFKSNRAAQLLDGASAAEVGRAVAGMSSLHGAPALIIIDTLARNFGGGDENSTQDMNGFVAAIDDLRAGWPKTTIIIVHHTGHSDKGRGRGSTVLNGALDFEFRVEKDDEEITIANTKMKDAPELPEQFFTLTDVELAPRIKSAVLVSSDASTSAPKVRKAKLTKPQQLALDTYKTAAAEHGIWDGGAFRGLHVSDWRPAFYAKHTGDNDKSKQRVFHRARADLVEYKKMTVQDDVYLPADADLIEAVLDWASRMRTQRTDRTNAGLVFTQKPEEGGQTGQMPKGMSCLSPGLTEEPTDQAGQKEITE